MPPAPGVDRIAEVFPGAELVSDDDSLTRPTSPVLTPSLWETVVSDQFDINALLNQAMEMQSSSWRPRPRRPRPRSTAAPVVERSRSWSPASMQFLDVTISPEAVDPDDVGMLEDLVLAALSDAMARIEALQRSSLGGLDLGALGGLTGMGGPAAGVPGGLPGFGGVLDATSSADHRCETPTTRLPDPAP